MKAKELITPKSKITYLYADMTVEDAISRFAKSSFSMIPVLERESGRYLYSVTANDVLNFITSDKAGDLHCAPLSSLSLTRMIAPCLESVEIKAISDLIANQNYVPLVDASGVFKGLVTRRVLIFHLLGEMERKEGR